MKKIYIYLLGIFIIIGFIFIFLFFIGIHQKIEFEYPAIQINNETPSEYNKNNILIKGHIKKRLFKPDQFEGSLTIGNNILQPDESADVILINHFYTHFNTGSLFVIRNLHGSMNASPYIIGSIVLTKDFEKIKLTFEDLLTTVVGPATTIEEANSLLEEFEELY